MNITLFKVYLTTVDIHAIIIMRKWYYIGVLKNCMPLAMYIHVNSSTNTIIMVAIIIVEPNVWWYIVYTESCSTLVVVYWKASIGKIVYIASRIDSQKM